MDLTEGPHFINCYVLSKVWYRCGSINLREGDYTAMMSLIKSWFYQDVCEKLSEFALYSLKHKLS